MVTVVNEKSVFVGQNGEVIDVDRSASYKWMKHRGHDWFRVLTPMGDRWFDDEEVIPLQEMSGSTGVTQHPGDSNPGIPRKPVD